MDFYSNLTIFYQNGYPFGVKIKLCGRYQPKKHICLVINGCYTISKSILVHMQCSWSHEAWDGNHRRISTRTSSISTKPIPIAEKSWVIFDSDIAITPCVYDFRLLLYHAEANYISYVRPGMGIIDRFLSQPCQFLLSKSPFSRKIKCLWGYVLLKRYVCMCGSRLTLYYSKVNISSLKWFMKPVMGIIDLYLLQPYYFLPASPHFEGKLSSCWPVFRQKRHVRAVVEWRYTISKSILVH